MERKITLKRPFDFQQIAKNLEDVEEIEIEVKVKKKKQIPDNMIDNNYKTWWMK